MRADVDPAGGRLRSAVARRPGRSRTSERTPPDAVLPHWEETLALVRRAASLLLPLRTAAWEVAPTPAGPVLLDADADHRPWHTPSCRAATDALAGAA